MHSRARAVTRSVPARRTARRVWANKIIGPITLATGVSNAQDILSQSPGTLKTDATVLDIEVIQNVHNLGTIVALEAEVDFWAGLYIAQEGLAVANLPDPGVDIEEVDWLHRWHFFGKSKPSLVTEFAQYFNIHQEDQVKTKRRFRENGRTVFYIAHNLSPGGVTYSHFLRTLLLVP